MLTVLTKQLQIAERSKRFADEGLTNLHQFIDEAWIEDSFRTLNKRSAAGVDNEDYAAYRSRIRERLPKLLSEFKTGKYKAPPVKRVYIKKSDGKQRPIGMPTIEDKVLQNTVRKAIEPIYENEFLDSSYGFRSNKSAHQALQRIWKETGGNNVWYVLDADIQNYFGSIDFTHLRSMLDKRVRDGVIRKQIDKWLKAGVLEEGKVYYDKKGTPQGGIISPLLSNIYLHEVLDEWFVEIKPLLEGKSFIVRYADDFVIGFAKKEDAERVMKVIFKRFAKFGLTLHPEKTKLIKFSPLTQETFDFLGFTHYWGRSRKGNNVIKRKTSRKSFRSSVTAVNKWLKQNRHVKVKDLIPLLNKKLMGHYGYFGITFNSRGINSYYETVKRLLHKWLNRRGGKNKNWDVIAEIVHNQYPLLKPRIVHSYL